MSTFFNPAAFFVSLREVLEMGLVFGIVMSYLRHTGNDHLRKWVYWGTGAAIVVSLAIGVAIGVIYHRSDNNFLSGKAGYIFEGVIYMIAALMLTWMIIWMMRMGQKIQAHMEAQMEEALNVGSKWGIFSLVFVHIFREGVELVILLVGADDDGNWQSVILPTIVGALVAVFICFLLFKGLMTLNIELFLFWSSAILLFFAAGLFSRAFHEIQEADAFGVYDLDKAFEQGIWWNFPLWNTVDCCNDKKNQFFATMRALFGYQDKPTFIELITYFGYWIVLTIVFVALYWNVVGSKKNGLKLGVQISAIGNWLVAFCGFIFVCANPTWNGLTVVVSYFVLSTIALIVSFDLISKYIARSKRRILTIVQAVGFAILTIFSFTLAMVQLHCRYPDSVQCSIPEFFYWMLIFQHEWLVTPPLKGQHYIAGATLCMAGVMTIYLCGFHALFSYKFSTNINDEGVYEKDLPVDVDEEQLLMKEDSNLDKDYVVETSVSGEGEELVANPTVEY